MKSIKQLLFSYTIVGILFLIYSYGFVDTNLVLSSSRLYQTIHNPLHILIFEKRGWAGGIYLLFLGIFWLLYYLVLKTIDQQKINITAIRKLIIIVSTIFLFSFPAFSYDIFNYMLTAKVTFSYKENPWIVRPIEIPNESALKFTRAANKVALYGPTWILLTYFPQILGLGNVWLTLIMFKLLILLFYYFFLLLLWETTKSIWNVTFFALNPLVLITILNEGHNDIVMMVLVCLGILLLANKIKIPGPRSINLLCYILSILVKGASIVLFPVFLVKKWDISKIWILAFWLMFVVFLVSPLREEMYPWYFIWCLSCLSFLPKSHRFLYRLSIAFCFGLLLRNTPYIVTRQYDGYNQLARTSVTWIPIGIYLCYSLLKHNKKIPNINFMKM